MDLITIKELYKNREQYFNKEIIIGGWVRSNRDSKTFGFIVVNDGSWDDTENIIKDFQEDYNNLYITTIPQETRIISHKKLAITVGVKAAKNEILLFTDADCRPLTPDWISSMVRNFDSQTEFVLGHGNYYDEPGFIGKLVSYDTLTIAMQYMGFALLGHPYMGVGRNMAYRKSTFFRLKGFAGFLHVASGDDDLLINAFGKKHNTRIEPSLEAETLSLPKTTFRDWYYQKVRHLSTVDVYKSGSKLWIGIEPFSRGLFYLSVLLLIILGYNNPLILAIGIGVYLFIHTKKETKGTSRIYAGLVFVLFFSMNCPRQLVGGFSF